MENPHEQVQNALLARIINNVVCSRSQSLFVDPFTNYTQERLNESVTILNDSLRVSLLSNNTTGEFHNNFTIGG